MTDLHPITPSPELLQQWAAEYWDSPREAIADGEKYIAIQAARWGADQELEACCADIHTVHGQHRADWLRSMRRPKPPSLAEQGLEQLNGIGTLVKAAYGGDLIDDHIRAALERLQELEKLSDDQG